MARFDNVVKIRAGTELCNLDAWCEYCSENLRPGGVKICIDNEPLFVCSLCLKTGKSDKTRKAKTKS